MELGKKLFSFTITDDLDHAEYIRMGRATRYRNARKNLALVLPVAFMSFVLSLAITPLIGMIALIAGIQFLVYLEYSARTMANNIKEKLPIDYDFHENGLIETTGGQSEEISYGRFARVKMDKHLFTFVGKKDDKIVLVPRSLLKEDDEIQLMKLQRTIG